MSIFKLSITNLIFLNKEIQKQLAQKDTNQFRLCLKRNQKK